MAKKRRKVDNHYLPYLVVALVLVIVLVLVTGDGRLIAKGPSTTISPVQVSVVTPNGGGYFHQGTANIITWKGGYNVVAVGLATPDADTNHTIAWTDNNPPYSGPQTNGATGKIIGFINIHSGQGYYLPNSSTTWDGLRVCNFHLNLDPDTWCKDVVPGSYKIFVWSQNSDGSMFIGSGSGPSGKYTQKDNPGNWDLSDQLFTILAP